MAITATQNPGTYNMAYGVNAVTLSGLTVEDKYVLQVWQGLFKLADIRQTANQNGTANFDIQNILQSYVEPSAGDIETITTWHDSEEEVFEYSIRYGTETDGDIDGDPNLQPDNRLTELTGFKSIGGRKDYYELNFDISTFQATAATDGESPCTIITQQGRAFTDWTEYKLISEITDEVPDWSSPTDKVYTQKVRRSDFFTLSVLNEILAGNPAPGIDVDKIESYRVSAFDEFGTLVTDFYLDNPLELQDPNYIVTAGIGPANFTSPLNPAVKYYYVGFPLWTADNCGTDDDFHTDASAMGFYRFDVVDDKCNDYTPIQFSWMNSYGFRDYFYFEKRNEKRVNISRNNYLAEPNDYNIGSFSVDRTSRGYTTYSQKLEETYVANTRFLQDYEAAFLQNLFMSPDVKVRFGDETVWYPVTLLTTTYTEKNYRKDKLFQYEISFKKAHNIKSQRG